MGRFSRLRELGGKQSKNPPDREVRRTRATESYRQPAAAPEPIISSDAEEIIAISRPETPCDAGGGAKRGAETCDIGVIVTPFAARVKSRFRLPSHESHHDFEGDERDN